jgi:hypothetical protein
MNWWDLGEWSGASGDKLATYQIACAFCGEKGNFETVQHFERQKPGGRKVLNYDTLKCGHCGNFMFAFWSAAGGIGGRGYMPIGSCPGIRARPITPSTGRRT